MEKKYFHVKVQFVTEDENTGRLKKVTVQYLVDAMSCTEAEARIVAFLGSGYTDYAVKSVSESPISTVISA